MSNKALNSWLEKRKQSLSKAGKSEAFISKNITATQQEISSSGGVDNLNFPVWGYVITSGTVRDNGVVRASSEANAKKFASEKAKKEGYKNPKIEISKPSAGELARVKSGELFMEEFQGEEIEEALNLQQRRQRGIVMKRYAKKIAMARKRTAGRMANSEHIEARARRAAIRMLRKRVAGSMGASYDTLSASQKMQVDKKVEEKKDLIGRIAQKLIPKIKKMEMDRLASRNSSSSQKES